MTTPPAPLILSEKAPHGRLHDPARSGAHVSLLLP